MYSAKENLPIKLELPGVTIRSTPWNGMAALYVQLAKGSDFTPVLKGLPDDLCQCPHWGYVLKGTLHLRYKDGREEIARVGDMWCTPPGHTAWCDEDCEYIEFSPEHDFNHVIDHVRRQLQAT
jgi:hypothetical protein